MQEEETAQSILSGAPGGAGGGVQGVGGWGGSREEGGRAFRKRSGFSSGAGASVLLLTMEHARLIPINFCHHL